MSFTNGDEDPFDPVIAERFDLLKQLEPPAGPLPMADSVAPARFLGVGRSRRQLVLLAAAVLAVGAASAGALVALRDGPTSGVTTVQPAGDQANPLQADDGQGSVLSVDPSPDPDSPSASPADDPGPDTTSIDQADPPTDASDTSDASGGSTESSTGASTSASTSSLPTSTASTVPATQPPPTTATGATSTSTGASSSTSIELNPGKDAIIVVRGTVTEVFTDCQSHLRLDGDQVVQVSPVSCDGGSWIRVDGTRIQTSSGFRSGDQAFDRHDPSLRPGRSVAVTAISPAGSGTLSLDCPTCQISGG